MGYIGFPELVVIFVVALLVFGPRKLPELGRSLGKGFSEFRRASTELRSSLEREMQTIEQETKFEDPTETPAEESTKTSAEVSTETPAEVSTETPAEVSTETPAEVSTETPAEVSAGSATVDEGSSNSGASSGEHAEVSAGSATVDDGSSNSGVSSGERQD